MINILLVLILAVIIGGSGFYIYRAKKAGQKCIGCPYSKDCETNKCSCNSIK